MSGDRLRDEVMQDIERELVIGPLTEDAAAAKVEQMAVEQPFAKFGDERRREPVCK